MMQKERIIRVGEDDVLPQKWTFEKSMVSVDLLEDVVVSMDKTKLVIAFAAWFIVEIQSILGNQYVIVA